MGRRVAIAGAAGQLGSQLVAAFSSAGNVVLGIARPEFDLALAVDLERVVAWQPDVVVNAAAWTDVDACARDPGQANRVNGAMAGNLAEVAARTDALFIQVSTNEVFDGTLPRPYVEDDAPNPLNPYGSSKLLGERLVASVARRLVIVRTAWIYGGPSSFPNKIRRAAAQAAAEQRPLRVVADEFGNPTPAGDLADRIASLTEMRTELPRILHLAGEPPTSRFDWASRVLAADGSRQRVEPIAASAYSRVSKPPLRAVLDTSRARGLGLEPIPWLGAPG